MSATNRGRVGLNPPGGGPFARVRLTLVVGVVVLIGSMVPPGLMDSFLFRHAFLQQNATPAGLEEENQSLRRETFLATHRDDEGKLRPGLWRQGLRAVQELPTSATWPASEHVAARLLRAPGSAPARSASASSNQDAAIAEASMANSVVVGVRWKQIGPAPLRIDTGGGNNCLGRGITCNEVFQGDGPDSGEVTDIAIDPRGSTDKTVYIATNDGGIWKTTNGGTSWIPLTDNMTSLSMGAVALDPVNPQIVYAGTGNGFDGGCQFTKGVGLYKSIDAGATWSQVGGDVFNNASINRIRVLSGNVVLVGANTGLFRSVDGGLNFGANAPLFNDKQPILQGNLTDIDIDTASPNKIYASVSGVDGFCTGNALAVTTGLFVSTDGGATFPTDLFSNAGVVPAAGSAYIAFAQGTNVSKTMYATVSLASTAWDGLYRSTDSGDTWARMAGADTPAASSGSTGCQCTYDQTIGVDPLNANRVYIGFQEIWLSTDGGGAFGAIPISNGEVHWDQHALVFSPPAHVPSTATTTPLWVGHDGGASRSTDGGTNWDNLNEGIATNLFKTIDIGRGAGNNGFTYGGTQDTGTIQHRPTDPANDWHLAVDGDGQGVAVDPLNAQHAIGMTNGTFSVTTDGGANWTVANPPGLTAADIFRVAFAPSNNQVVWASSSSDTGGFRPGNQLFRSPDGGANFTSVGTFGTNISAIGTDPQNANNLWLGFTNGTVQNSTNALAATPTFTALPNQPGPGRRVSSVAVDPTDSNTAVVTYEGFSNSIPAGQLTQNVFRTTDAGATAWTDIGGTVGGTENLPNLPTHSAVIDASTTPHTIIVSNDGGVLRSLDNGATWQILGTGLPTVDSTSLALDASVTPPVLRVGTYGRSVFELVSAVGPVIDTKGDLAFGEVKKGRTDTRTVQVFNVGSTDLHVSSFTRTAGSVEFSVLTAPAFPATITPGQSIDVKVNYAPTDLGSDTATFTVQSDDPTTPNLQIPASGTGVETLTGSGGGDDDCARRYVAQGDGVVVGTDIGNDSGADQRDRYSDKLLNDRLKKITGAQSGDVWCLYNTATDPATTDTFVKGSNSQQSQAWNLRPHLITLELGRQNTTIVDHVDKCFKNIKDHDFHEANVCALNVLNHPTVWDKLKKDLGAILNNYKTQMSGNPNLVVSVLGYYNPYPTASSVATKIPGFCAKLVDTIPTCIARWVMLPPALVTLDQVVKKLNDTIAPVVKQFTISSQGRFFFINPYDKFKDHCMTMKVKIKTRVYHPPSTVDNHDTDETNFGCDKNWVVSDGKDGTKSPFPYLTPASNGVLLVATQTTKEMGINPNKKGHQCLSDLIWETVKNKLGIPEKQDLANACSSI